MSPGGSGSGGEGSVRNRGSEGGCFITLDACTLVMSALLWTGEWGNLLFCITIFYRSDHTVSYASVRRGGQLTKVMSIVASLDNRLLTTLALITQK